MRYFDLTSENETFLTSARALREFCSGYPVKPLKFCKIDFLNVIVFSFSAHNKFQCLW